MLCGHYVKTFAEATHALPEGMHMSSDYPFVLPRIVEQNGNTVTLKADRMKHDDITLRIYKKGDSEVCYIRQRSSFEAFKGYRTKLFVCYPFKNER